jgi:hypothetical protein
MRSKCSTFLICWIILVPCALGAMWTPAGASARPDYETTDPLSQSVVAAALQALHRAEPYLPSSTQCDAQPAPSSVIAALQKTQVKGLHVLAAILAACNSNGNLIEAFSSVGGFTNPEVVAINDLYAIDNAIQRGEPISSGRIEQVEGVHSKELAALLLAERRNEDP